MAEPVAYINGKRHVLPAGRADQTLLSYLRGRLCPGWTLQAAGARRMLGEPATAFSPTR